MLKNKVRYVAMGMVIGSIVTMGGQGFANTPLNAVTAFVSNLIQFEINGEKAELPSDYEVIVYHDRTYVPVRFISEQLGATVGWNNDTKVIKIDTPVREEVEPNNSSSNDTKPTENNNAKEDDSNKNYRKVPVTYSDLDMLLGVSVITNHSNDWKVYMVLENKGTIPLQLRQSEMEIIVDGKEYFMKDVPAHKLDTKWYHDVKEDERLEGYISLPQLHENPKKMDLKLTVFKNDGSGEKREVEFNILMDNQ